MGGSLWRAPSYRPWIAPKDLLTAGDVPESAEGITLAEADAVWADSRFSSA